MKKISKEELNKTLGDHKLWLQDWAKGQRADLRKANLTGGDLEGAIR